MVPWQSRRASRLTEDHAHLHQIQIIAIRVIATIVIIVTQGLCQSRIHINILTMATIATCPLHLYLIIHRCIHTPHNSRPLLTTPTTTIRKTSWITPNIRPVRLTLIIRTQWTASLCLLKRIHRISITRMLLMACQINKNLISRSICNRLHRRHRPNHSILNRLNRFLTIQIQRPIIAHHRPPSSTNDLFKIRI